MGINFLVLMHLKGFSKGERSSIEGLVSIHCHLGRLAYPSFRLSLIMVLVNYSASLGRIVLAWILFSILHHI